MKRNLYVILARQVEFFIPYGKWVVTRFIKDGEIKVNGEIVEDPFRQFKLGEVLIISFKDKIFTVVVNDS